MMAQGLQRSSHEHDVRQSPIYQEVLRHLGPSRTVLDIGAGVGRFSVPLAQDSCHVTAIEPSLEMRTYLDEALSRTNQHQRVRIMDEAWPGLAPVTAEVALAAFVIQFAPDPIAFVRAMQQSASRRCVLAIHVDSMFGAFTQLWEEFHDTPAPPLMPVFSNLYPKLLEAGIVTNVQIIEESHGPQFRDPDRVLSMLSHRLHIQDNAEAQAKLSRWLENHRQEWTRPHSTRSALLSWTPDHRS
jgi:SAM-dependent methyltransferase